VTAIHALARLPGAHLVIAGDGPLRAMLVDLADQLRLSHRLHLIGNLDPQDLADLVSSADLYLFPSVWESFGLAGVEAAMAGVPVLASDLPVLREVLAPAADHGLARFHPPADPARLADAAAALLALKPGKDLRLASAEATGRQFAIDRMIDAYCRLIAGDSAG
jgi:glycosyltransferase involved in cell wall biosynthesis